VLDDPEDAAAELESLRAYREEVLQRLQAAEGLGARRMRGIEIGTALTHLQYVAANLLNIIEHGGKFVAEPGWGVFAAG
jgi:hypothetical protein